jgi:transposase-like protein
MHQTHVLLSAEARTLSLREVFALSEDQAFELFRTVRWGRDGQPVCPHCGVVDAHWFLPSRRQWRCRSCGHTFSLTSGDRLRSPQAAVAGVPRGHRGIL